MDFERICHPESLQLQNEEALSFAGFSYQRKTDLNEQMARYHDFSTRCFLQEMAVVITVLVCFALGYLLCYLTGLELAPFCTVKSFMRSL